MEILREHVDIKTKYTATIGFFDGMHCGHRFLLDELRSVAKKKNQQSLVVTFVVHPRKVLHADFQPQLLTTLSEKLSLLESTQIDACAVLDFTPEMAQMLAYDFMKTILKERYNVSTLLVGHDHHFGYNRNATFLDYVKYGKELGIEVIQTSRFSTDKSETISSSEIRQMISKGATEDANQMLGYEYSFRGKVVYGFKIGGKIGFPTANLMLEDDEKIIPPIGVYAVKVRFKNQLYWGMLNIGNRPTLDNGNNISIEVHILDFDTDIYNQNIEIRFVKRLREEKKFNNVDELVSQLYEDKKCVQELAEKNSPLNNL